MSYLPMTKEEMNERGWHYADIVIVTGDAYVDHPSFGTAVIGRVLEDAGFKVCISAQPASDGDYTKFGKPRYAFFVNSGNIDSMVAHYTASKRKRSDDAYTPGGKAGKRPDRAVTVYCKNIRRIYGDVPVAIGGIEASLRRFAHYDYWDDKVRPSILIDSEADILMFGMGERSAVEIAKRLKNGASVDELRDIRGTCYISDEKPDALTFASFEAVSEDSDTGRFSYAIACRVQQEEHDAVRGKALAQKHGERYVVQNPPQPPLSTEELDALYRLPFERNWHPAYDDMGGVPGIEEVKFSIAHNRGCFGGCNFCAIAYHQGRAVTARSVESILEEARLLTQLDGFKGYIHDVGGPTANFRRPSCEKQKKLGLCPDRKCLAPTPCRNLIVDHREYLSILRKLREVEGVKRVFIRSGVRFDYLMEDENESFFKDLVKYHVSGQLKVAPEHCSNRVLDAMGKPHIEVYEAFKQRFNELTRAAGLKQYLVPYLISSHPGSTLDDAIELALFLKKEKMHPEQVQDFYPTPGTVSTCMFYTGLDPYTMKQIYVPRTPKEKARQRALLQYYRPENHAIVKAALLECGREDLIGYSPDCLIGYRPYKKKDDTEKKPERASEGRSDKKDRKPDKRDQKKSDGKASRGRNERKSAASFNDRSDKKAFGKTDTGGGHRSNTDGRNGYQKSDNKAKSDPRGGRGASSERSNGSRSPRAVDARSGSRDGAKSGAPHQRSGGNAPQRGKK